MLSSVGIFDLRERDCLGVGRSEVGFVYGHLS